MTRILIIGGSGLLGHNIVRPLAQKHELFAGFFKNPPAGISASPILIDITRSDLLSRQIGALGPAMVVHAAGIASPDECEANPDGARQLIVEGTRNVVRACGECGCRLVFISTDLVFDGRRGCYREEDSVAGINVYADCKIAAERVVQENMPSATILRIALLYGKGTPAHPGQIELMLWNWRAGISGTFFTDQYRTPLFAPQVADIAEALLNRPDFHGVLHAGGGERVSRFAFAGLVAERVNAPRELIRPGSMWDIKATARRGADCSLVSNRLERELGIKPLTCAEGLDLLVKSGYLKPME
jgi:dTDP-4-dehydrorhamnose reductase